MYQYCLQEHNYAIGHANECPTIDYFGNRWQTQSKIYDFDWLFWEIPWKNALWDCCKHAHLYVVALGQELSWLWHDYTMTEWSGLDKQHLIRAGTLYMDYDLNFLGQGVFK